MKFIYIFYKLRTFFYRLANYAFKKLKIKHRFATGYKGWIYLNCDETQERIKEIINAGKPAMVARFGGTETKCIFEAIGVKLGIKKHFAKKPLQLIQNYSGVFPYGEKMAMRFSEITIEAGKNVDLLGQWSSNYQDYLIKHVCPSDITLTALEYLEPYYSENPWTAALKGKKVLVVHPFKETIESQYKKHKLLFDNPDMLPDFDLKVVKAVQTIAGEEDSRFKDWEEALNYMHKEVMKHDFDVAIIGCGAYGMPLASMIKNSGKIAIHLGGPTQLLFGIKGARWDNHPLSRLYNEHWVCPLKSETPAGAKKVEGACYW